MKQIKNVNELEKVRESIVASRDPNKPLIIVCGGTGCRASGSEVLAQELAKELKKHKLTNKVDLKMSGCHGFCQRGPVVLIYPQDIFYQMVGKENPERDARDIVKPVSYTHLTLPTN